ncbi:MAG: HAD hydrolase-like protein [Sodaliphilus pleomorphus]|uniref:HAD family hydrolase n=1 Tax=Sodaliphilus pleomorphus TaxID=2606626 RepID=UPI002A75C890|nr:HAD hydrolase-like protein [Sodaliphilus pleomorphus]MDY2831437.1 HAD hydrolase-like protein [Sodaliphilus pleomorphus]
MRDYSNQLTFVFDLDNTLVETDRANNLSYMDAINTVLHSSISWDFNNRFTRNELRLLFPNLTEELYKSVIKTKNERFYAHMGDTTLNTNLVKVLGVLYSTGCRTILLTNCHRERALSVCNHYGISQLFSDKYYAEDKVGSKYEVLIRNGFDLSSVILFENETEGAQEAMANGIAERNIIGIKF